MLYTFNELCKGSYRHSFRNDDITNFVKCFLFTRNMSKDKKCIKTIEEIKRLAQRQMNNVKKRIIVGHLSKSILIALSLTLYLTMRDSSGSGAWREFILKYKIFKMYIIITVIITIHRIKTFYFKVLLLNVSYKVYLLEWKEFMFIKTYATATSTCGQSFNVWWG